MESFKKSNEYICVVEFKIIIFERQDTIIQTKSPMSSLLRIKNSPFILFLNFKNKQNIDSFLFMFALYLAFQDSEKLFGL